MSCHQSGPIERRLPGAPGRLAVRVEHLDGRRAVLGHLEAEARPALLVVHYQVHRSGALGGTQPSNVDAVFVEDVEADVPGRVAPSATDGEGGHALSIGVE